MAAGGSAYTTIHAFASDGSAAQGVGEGSDGALYGTSEGGGSFGKGFVFKVGKDGSSYATLRSFGDSATDGQYVRGVITEGSDGVLYGTTAAGGTANLGTVYRINRDGSGYAVLKHFTGSSDGETPSAGVIHASDNFLYGTTPGILTSTTGKGTVYRLRTDGSGYSVLRNFTGGIEGSNPSYAGVVEKDGMLYGTTAEGGAFSRGTIYRMSFDGSNYTTLINFSAADDEGGVPNAGLMLGSDGVFYGTTVYVGNGSVIYRFDPN